MIRIVLYVDNRAVYKRVQAMLHLKLIESTFAYEFHYFVKVCNRHLTTDLLSTSRYQVAFAWLATAC